MKTADRPLDVALQMVARRREHGAYGNGHALLKALRRRIGTIDEDDAVTLLERAATLYDAAVTVAAQNVAPLMSARTGRSLKVPDHVREEIRELVPGESNADYDEAVSWVFYVNHLR